MPSSLAEAFKARFGYFGLATIEEEELQPMFEIDFDTQEPDEIKFPWGATADNTNTIRIMDFLDLQMTGQMAEREGGLWVVWSAWLRAKMFEFLQGYKDGQFKNIKPKDMVNRLFNVIIGSNLSTPLEKEILRRGLKVYLEAKSRYESGEKELTRFHSILLSGIFIDKVFIIFEADKFGYAVDQLKKIGWSFVWRDVNGEPETYTVADNWEIIRKPGIWLPKDPIKFQGAVPGGGSDMGPSVTNPWEPTLYREDPIPSTDPEVDPIEEENKPVQTRKKRKRGGKTRHQGCTCQAGPSKDNSLKAEDNSPKAEDNSFNAEEFPLRARYNAFIAKNYPPKAKDNSFKAKDEDVKNDVPGPSGRPAAELGTWAAFMRTPWAEENMKLAAKDVVDRAEELGLDLSCFPSLGDAMTAFSTQELTRDMALMQVEDPERYEELQKAAEHMLSESDRAAAKAEAKAEAKRAKRNASRA